MKLCENCGRLIWPYVVVLSVAGFCSLLTWLTLGAEGVDPTATAWWTGGVFLVVLAGMVAYMASCIRRHCSHGEHA